MKLEKEIDCRTACAACPAGRQLAGQWCSLQPICSTFLPSEPRESWPGAPLEMSVLNGTSPRPAGRLAPDMQLRMFMPLALLGGR